MDLFFNKIPNIANPNELTPTELPVVADYAREAYLAVSLLLSFDRSIEEKSIEYMGKTMSWGRTLNPV